MNKILRCLGVTCESHHNSRFKGRFGLNKAQDLKVNISILQDSVIKNKERSTVYNTALHFFAVCNR